MHKNIHNPLILIGIVLIVISLASCNSAKPAPKPTATHNPATETATKRPTTTPPPTSTPNIAITQAYEDLFEQVKEYKDKGYISTLDGSYTLMADYSKDWAQMGWYEWKSQNRWITNFVYSGHFNWSSASETPEISGCGIVFAIQPNDDHYAVILDKARILFLHAVSTSRYSHEVGTTRGTGHVNISKPYRADFSLVVNGIHAYVLVDKTFIGEYTLSADSVMSGKIGYTINSGTNKDYGTKCEITNSRLWVIK